MPINSNYFSVKPINGNETEVQYNICFNPHYRYIWKYELFRVYTPVNHITKFTDKEVADYIKYLNKIGFKISVEFDAEFTYNKANHKGQIFTIDLKDSSPISGLICLNAIRYLYEGDFHKIVSAFLRYSKQRSKINFYNRFILAHSTYPTTNENHYILPDYTFVKMLSDEEVEKQILKLNKQITRVCDYLPQFSKYMQGNDRTNIQAIIENGNIKIKDAYEQYLEITKKYDKEDAKENKGISLSALAGV